MLCSWFLFSSHLLRSSNPAQTSIPLPHVLWCYLSCRYRSSAVFLFSACQFALWTADRWECEKKVDVQSFTSVSPLLIWVVCSSPEAFRLTKVCRDINSLLTPCLHVPEVSSHICCYTHFSVWTHLHKEPRNYYVRVLPKIGHYRQLSYIIFKSSKCL